MATNKELYPLLCTEEEGKRNREIPPNKPKPPQFVKLNNSGLRLLKNGKEYYRDGGAWSIGFRYIEGKWVSWKTSGIGIKHLHKVELIEITEEEWRESNKGYI